LKALKIELEFVRTSDSENPYAVGAGELEVRYLLREEQGDYQEVQIRWTEALKAQLEELRLMKADASEVQAMGEWLRGLLKHTHWDQREEQILEAADAGIPVDLLVRSRAAEIYGLPWELIALGESGRRLGAVPGLTLRYCWPDTRTVQPTPQRAGRVLFAWCDAGGTLGRAPAVQGAAVASACQASGIRWVPEKDMLRDASVAAIQQAMDDDDRPVSVLHLLCHGAEEGKTFGISLYGADRVPVVVDAGRLRDLLAPHADHLRMVVLCACDGGNTGAMGNVLGSIAQTLHRSGIETVIAFRYPVSIVGANTFSACFYPELLVNLASVESALAKARARLLAEGKGLDWASLQLYARPEGQDLRPVTFAPYPGAGEFYTGWERFFFGRSAECRETLEKLEALVPAHRPRALWIAGLGKSSFVRASVLPTLAAQQLSPGNPRWAICTATMTDEPDVVLREALGRELAPNTDLRSQVWTREGLVGRLTAWAKANPGRRLLLVLDDLEQLPRRCAPETVDRVLSLWWSLLADPTLPLWLIALIRPDYLPGVWRILAPLPSGAHLQTEPGQAAHRVILRQLDEAGLREAIEGPCARVGLELDLGLADRIVEDLRDEPANLTLVSQTMRMLWERREGRQLTQASYSGMGRVEGALYALATDLTGRLSGEDRKEARRVLVRLAGVGGRALPLPLEQLRPRDAIGAACFEKVTDLLADRLMVFTSTPPEGGDQAKPVVVLQLAHEALATWPTLRHWIQEDRPHMMELVELEQWVQEWKRHRALLDGRQLGYAQRVIERHQEDVTPDMRLLVQESLKAGLRVVRMRRLVSVGSLMMAVAAIVFGLYVDRLRDRAEKDSYAARDARRLALAEQRRDKPAAAIALLRELELGQVGPHWQEAALDLLSAPVPEPLDLPPDVRGEASPDRSEAVLGGSGWLWRVNLKDWTKQVLEPPEGTVQEVVWSANGQWVALSTWDEVAGQGRLRVAPPAELERPSFRIDLAGAAEQLSLSADGTQLRYQTRDGTPEAPTVQHWTWTLDGIHSPIAVEAPPPDPREPLNIRRRIPLSDGGVLLLDAEDRLWEWGPWGWAPGVEQVLAVEAQEQGWLAIDKTGRSWTSSGPGAQTPEGAPTAAWVGPGRILFESPADHLWIWDPTTGAGDILRGQGHRPQKVWFREQGMVSMSQGDPLLQWTWARRPDILPAGRISPDGSLLLQEDSPILWDLVHLQPHRLVGVTGVEQAVFSPDSRYLWLKNGTQSWLVTRDQVLQQLPDLEEVQFSEEGGLLASRSGTGAVELWGHDPQKNKFVPLRSWPEEEPSGMKLAPDGQALMLLGERPELWTATGGDWTQARRYPLGLQDAAEAWFDGDWLYFREPNKKLWRWRSDGRAEPQPVEEAEQATVVEVGGGRLVLGWNSGRILVQSQQFIEEPGKKDLEWVQETLRIRGRPVAQLRLSPEGDRLAASLVDGTGLLWKLGKPSERLWARERGGVGMKVAFGPRREGQRELLLWSKKGTQILTYSGHSLMVGQDCALPRDVRFSGEKLLVVAGATSTCLVELERNLERLKDQLWSATPWCLSPGWREEHLGEPPAAACTHFRACRERTTGERPEECPREGDE
jgi:CHAT domain